jgi:hypothetical protein
MRTSLFLVFLLVAPAARAADAVVLLPATGANVPEAELAAATDLLRGDLEATGRYHVVLGTTPGGNVAEPAPAEAAEEARRADAALAVTLRISRLGSASTARLAAYRPDGTTWYADQLGAANPDDLDPVLLRLARGLAEARPAAQNADVDTVTEREARPPRRLETTHVRGLRLDVSWLYDHPEDVGHVSGLGFFWLYDARSFLAEVSADAQFGGGDVLLDTGLGVYLPFTRGNVAPYAGGGLGWAIIHRWHRTDAGLEAKAAAGLLVGRLSRVQLRGEVGFRRTLFELRVNGDRRTAQGPFLNVGIGF